MDPNLATQEYQLPGWAILALVVGAPAAKWIFDNVLKPWWDRNVSKDVEREKREREEDERLLRAAERATAERDALIQARITDLQAQIQAKEQRIVTLEEDNELCKQEKVNNAVVMTRLTTRMEIFEERLRAAQERVTGLSSENAGLRKMLVDQEAASRQAQFP